GGLAREVHLVRLGPRWVDLVSQILQCSDSDWTYEIWAVFENERHELRVEEGLSPVGNELLTISKDLQGHWRWSAVQRSAIRLGGGRARKHRSSRGEISLE